MRNKYEVYAEHTQFYDDRTNLFTEVLGTTYAVSEKQAINNVKFRLGINNSDLFCDYGGDSYSRRTTIKARLCQ